MRKYCSSDQEKLLKFETESQNWNITRTIYSNSERSVQFLKQNDSLTCFWRFRRSNTLVEQLELKFEKINGNYKFTGEVKK